MELFVQAGRPPARPVHVSLQSINQSGVHVHADKTRELSKWTGITSIDKKKIYLHIDPTVSVAPAGGGKRFVHIVGQLAPTSTDRCALAGAGQAISGRDGAGASAGSASSARGGSCDDGGVGVGVGRAPVSKIHAGERITQKRAGVGGGPRTPPSAFFSPNQVFKVGFLIFSPGIIPLCRLIWL